MGRQYCLAWLPALFITGVSSAPSTENTECSSTQVCSPGSVFLYEVGRVYKYEYRVSTTSEMKGASDDKSSVSFTAGVEIGVSAPCNFVLRVTGASLGQGRSGQETQEFSQSLQRYNLNFGFESGRVREVCSSREDPLWAVNLKKGILSAFQQSLGTGLVQENVTETDVVGRCETQYTPTGSGWGRSNFKKVKDMYSCTANQEVHQYALNLPDMNIQHLPILATTHECDVSLQEGRLSHTQCTETHLFQPFSNQGSGATTTVTQSLSLQGEAVETLQPGSNDIRTDLTFVHDNKQLGDVTDESFVQQQLDRVVIDPTFRDSDMPEVFRSLVYSMRNLQHSQMVMIYNGITHRKSKKLFEDALPLLKTDAGISLMRDIIKSGSIPQDVVDSWFSSLTFYKNPTRAMLTVLSIFLEPSPEPHHSALLGISSLASTYCANNPECIQTAELRDLVTKLEHLLGRSCETSSREEEDRMVLVLKGIRNIGLMTGSAETLTQCYKTKSNPMWVRVAAVETIQTLSCHYPDTQFGLLQSLTDIQEDSELRIGVYRAVMACPTETVVDVIRRILTMEQVNQVGSYIWTHLSNLQETKSKDETKIKIKKLIGSEELVNKWNTDVRKFSRNVEFSQFFNEWRVGGTVDSNLIFSEHSFIPRSAMVNLTTSLFGENINLFEVGIRAEGFEKMFGNLFGPEGHFRDDTVHEFLKHLMRSKREIEDSGTDGARDTFGTKAKDEDPRGSMYLRFFGKDIKYTSFDGLSIVSSLLKNPRSIMDLVYRDSWIDYEKSTMFLDGAIITPTVAGLPLNLTVQGTSSVSLKSDIDVNLRELGQSGKAELQVDFEPSASLEIICIMGVDAFVTKTGLRSTTKVHSSLELGGNIDIDGSKLVKVQMNMPRDKMEIFEASVNYFLYNNGVFEEMESYQREENHDYCTPRFVSDLFGVQTCGNIGFYRGRSSEDPNWIYAGPSKADIILRKTDSFDSLIAKYAWTTQTSNSSKGTLNDIHFIYDTPGSSLVRKTIAGLKFDDLGRFFDVDLIIPALDIKANIKYDWTDEKKNLNALLSVSSQDVIRLTQSLVKYPNKYEAVLGLTYLDTRIINWNGSLHSAVQSGRHSLDVSLEGSLHPTITISGDLTKKGDKLEIGGTLNSTFLNVEFTTDCRVSETGYKVKGSTQYSVAGGTKHSLKIVGKSARTEQGELTSRIIHLDLNLSQFPRLKSTIDWKVQTSPGYINNDGKVKVGNTTWVIEQKHKSFVSIENQELLLRYGLSVPAQGQFHYFHFHHKAGMDSNFNQLAIKLNEDVWFDVFSQYEYVDSPFTYRVNGGLSYPGRELTAGLNITEPESGHGMEHDGNIYLQWDPQGRIHSVFNILRGNSAHMHYVISSTTNISGMEPIILNGNLADLDDRTSANMQWNYGEEEYAAVIEYFPGDNSTSDKLVKGKLDVNKVKYEGNVQLKNTNNEKSILIDIAAEKRVYLLMQLQNQYNQIKFDFSWDKDRDDTKQILIETSLLRDNLLAHLKFFEYEGRVNGSYTSDSIDATIQWGEKRADIELKCILTLFHQEILLGLASTNPLFEHVKLHLRFLLVPLLDGSRTLDSKVEVRLNSHHHLGEISGMYGTTKELNIKTSSTLSSFDAISLEFSFTNTPRILHVRGNGTHQQKNILFDFNHRPLRDHLFPANGGLILRTPISQIISVDADYSVALESGHLQASGSVTRNARDTVRVQAVGFLNLPAHMTLNMTVDHTFGNKKTIHVFTKLNQDSLSFNNTLTVTSGEFTLKSSAKSRTYPSPRYQLRMKTIGPNPARLDIEYHSVSKKLKSQLKYQNIQMAALQFEHSVTSLELFQSIVKAQFLMNKLEFEAMRNENLTLAKAELVRENRDILVTKVQHEVITRTDFQKETFDIIFVTPSESFPVMEFAAVSLERNNFSSLNIDLSYQGISTHILKESLHQTDGSYLFTFNTTSDIEIISNVFINMNKKVQHSEEMVTFDFILNDKNFTIISEHAINFELEKNSKLLFRGPWGTAKFNLQEKAVLGGKSIIFQFIDSDGKQTEMTGKHHKTDNQFKFELTTKTPVTDIMVLVVEGEIGPPHRISLTAKSGSTEEIYLDITAEGRIEQTKLSGELLVEIAIQDFVKQFDVVAEIDFKKDLSLLLADGSIAEVELKLSCVLDKLMNYDLSVKGKNAGYNIMFEFDLMTPEAGYENINGKFETNIEDKSVRILLMKNYETFIEADLRATIEDNGLDIRISAALPVEYYSTLALSIEADYETKALQIFGSREEDVLKFAGSLTKTDHFMEINCLLESSTSYWKNFNLNGRLDLSSGANLVITGNSEDNSNMVDVLAELGSGMGNIKVELELPMLGITQKNISLDYIISEGNCAVNADFSGDIITMTVDYDGTAYGLVATTPFDGFEDISSRVTLLNNDDKLSIDVLLDISGKVNTVIGYYYYNRTDLSIDCKSGYDFARKTKIELKQFNNKTEVILAYNDMFVQAEVMVKDKERKAYIYYRSVGHDLVIKCDQTSPSNQIGLRMNVVYNGDQVILETIFGDSQIYLETISPLYYKKSIKLSWKEGQYEIFLEHHDIELISVKLKHDIGYYKGKVDLFFKINFKNIQNIHIIADYDILEANKALDLKFVYGLFFFDVKAKWTMTHDTLNGVANWKSSIHNWEDAIFELSYVIKTKSSIHYSVEKNGTKEEINMEVEIPLNHYIPTVHIKTTFKEYEDMKFSGNYSIIDGNGFIEMTLKRNSELVVKLYSDIMIRENWSEIDVNSVFTIMDQDNVTILFHFEKGNPFRFRTEVHYSNDQVFSIFGQIAMDDMAFSVDIKTPISDFEEFNLSGQLGTTSIKSIASFRRRGRTKREVSLDYDIDNSGARIDIQTPFDSMRRVKFSTSIQSDRSVEFSFDTLGERDFSFGVKYNFTENWTTGTVLAVFRCPYFSSDYKLLVDYHNLDGNFENGFDIKFSLFLDGAVWLSGKAARSPGHTLIEVTTPVNGWRKVSLVIVSDWKTKTEFTFKRDSRQTRVQLEQHGLFNYSISVETPYEGYENVNISSTKIGNTITLQVSRNDQITSVISVEVVGMIDNNEFQGSTGSLKVKWDSDQNIHIYVNTSFDGVKGIFSVDTSFDAVKTILLEVGVIKSGLKRKFKAIAKLNDQFIMYESLSSWTDIKIESKSRTTTNIAVLGFNRSDTHMTVTYSTDLSKPIEFVSETKTDGVVTFDTVSSLQIDLHGGEVKLIYKGDFPCRNGQVNALLHIKANLETRFEINGKWDVNTFRMKILLGGLNAEAKLESSFRQLENLVGRALWTVDQGPTSQYGLNVLFESCQSSCNNTLKFEIMFDTKPFQQLDIKMYIDGILNETLSLTYEKMDTTYHMVAVYTGLKDLNVNASLDLPKKSVDITIENLSDGRWWKLKTNAEIEIRSMKSIIVNVQLIVRTPFTEDFTAIVIVDFVNPMKEFELAFEFGAIDASLKSNIFWEPSNADILIEVSCPPLGFNKLSLRAKRESYQHLEYRFTFDNTTVELVSRNALNANDFTIDMQLKWPIQNFENIQFNVKGEKIDGIGESGEALLVISGHSTSVKYSRNNLDITLEITTPIELIQHVMVKTDIDKCKNYDIEIVWNISKIKLKHLINCDTYSSKIHYESDFPFLEKLMIDFLPKGSGNFGIALEFIGLNLNLSLNGESQDTRNGKHFSWNVFSNGEQFTADMIYTLETNSKHVNMTYFWGHSQTITINAILNTLDDNSAEFVLEFTSPFETMEYVFFEATMNNEATVEGKMKVEFNNEIIEVELGSNGDHLYLEVDTPIPNFETLKVDINHHDGNMKTTVLYGSNRVDANFVRKTTIYHFDIFSNLNNSSYRFSGKIDVEGKSLTTLVVWDQQKVRMKANSNGNSMSVSITSRYNSLKNMKIKGNWKWITGGFSLHAYSDLSKNQNFLNKEFQAEFVRTDESTSGFWVARSSGEEIRFDLNVDKAPGRMGVMVSLQVPDTEKLLCHVHYNLENSLVAGAVNFQCPWTQVRIEFRGGFKREGEFEIFAMLEAPEKIFNLDATMKITSLEDIEFRVNCEVPALTKSLGVQFIFKPKSLQDFVFIVTLTLDDVKFGGGAAFKLEGYKVDAQISVYTPVINGDYKMGGEYSSTPSTVVLSLYFNQATWKVIFDADTGNFSAKSKFDLTQFVTSILGSIIQQNLPIIIKEVEFEVEYRYLESAKILASIEDRGKVEFSFSVLGKRIIGNLEVNIAHLNVSKMANFAFEYSKHGQLEISVGDNGDLLELEVVGDDPNVYRGPRKVRAVFSSEDTPTLGFEYDRATSKGVLRLTTKSGIHKVSYNVKRRSGYDISLTVESPYLNNGMASIKLLIDPENNKYEGHFSLNNDHFVGAYFYMKNIGIDSKIEFDSTLLRNKIELKVKMEWEDFKLASIVDFSFKSKHKIIANIDIESQTLFVSLSSRYIPYTVLTIDGGLNIRSHPYTAKLRLGYGEENIEVSAVVTVKSDRDISGLVSFAASQFTHSKANLEFGWIWESNKELRLTLTTANPTIPRVSFNLQLLDYDHELVLIGVIRLPLMGHEHYQLKIKSAKNNDWKDKSVDLTLSTIKGEHYLLLSWSLTGSQILVKVKLENPHGIRYHSVTTMSWQPELKLYSNMNLPWAGEIHVKVFSSYPLDQWRNSVQAEIHTREGDSEISCQFDFVTGAEIVGELKTPIPDYQHQRIALGFDNSVRKMLKAHFTAYGRSNGLELEYLFNSISELVILLKLDLPFPSWTDITFDIQNRMTEDTVTARFGVRVNDNEVSSSVSNHLGYVQLSAVLNDNKIILIKRENNGQEYSLDMVHSSSKIKLEYEHRKHQDQNLFTIFKLISNEQENILFHQNVPMSTLRMKVEDLILPYSVTSTILTDIEDISHLSVALKLFLCWDTLSPENHSVDVQSSLQRTYNGGGITFSGRLPAGEAFTARSLVETVGGRSSTVIHVFRGEEGANTYRRLVSQSAFFLQTERESEQILYLGLPWQVFHLFQHTSSSLALSHSRGSIHWGEDDEKFTGLGYMVNRDSVERRVVVSRQQGLGMKRDNCLTVILGKEGTNRQVQLRVDHPQDGRRFAVKVQSDFVHDNNVVRSKLYFGYSVRSSETKYIETEVSYDKLAQTFIAVTTDGRNIYEAQGGWRVRGQVHSQEIEIRWNNIRLIQVDLSLNGLTPSATCKLRTQYGVDILLFAGLEDDREIMTLISHTIRGAEMEDIRLKFSLEKGNSISSSVTWRHGVIQDVQSSMRDTADWLEAATSSQPWIDLENSLDILHTLTGEMTGDLVRLTDIQLNQAFIQTMTWTSYVRELTQGSMIELLVQYYTSSFDVFAQFAIEVADEIQIILISSTQSLHTNTYRFFLSLKHSLANIRSRSVAVKNLTLHFLRNFDSAFENVGNRTSNLIWRFKHIIDSVAARYHRLIDFYMERSLQLRTRLWNTVYTQVVTFVTSVSHYLNQFQAVQKAVELFQKAVIMIKENNIWSDLHTAYIDVRDYMEENLQFVSYIREKMWQWYTQGKSWLVANYLTFSKWPIVTLLSSSVRGCIHITREILRYYTKDYTIQQLSDLIISRLDNIYISSILRVANFIYNSDELLSYTFEFIPEEGLLHYTQVLPIIWNRLSEVPKIFNIFGHTEKPANIDVTSFYLQMHNIVRTLYQAVYSQTVLPPFSAIAMVIGNNQIMTFDRKFYDFVGNCSYLLTEDFNHNRFSVSANYKNQQRESLTIQLEGRVIKMNTDGKVLLGNTMIDLPYSFNNTFIWREGDRITLINKKGLNIICNIIFNTCSIKISGWYFAKTGGLLGVYDNEPSNDWMTSERVIVGEVGEFAESWQEDTSCPVNYQPLTPDLTEWDRKKCEDYFNNPESNLGPCFDVVDPAPFLEMCYRQSEYVKYQPSEYKGFCQVTTAYIELCKLNSLELRLPGECYYCRPEGRPVERGGGFTNYLHNTAPRSADVIFVVQQGTCLQQLKLNSILGLVESSLQEKGIGSNLYSVVGYGGPGDLHDPITFTSASRVFSTHDTVLQALDRLSSLGTGGDVFEAITFAARMPTRAAVARVMIAVTCDTITDGRFYGDAIVMLKEGLIRLHYLNPARLALKNKKNAMTIYGFDKSSVFTAKSMNNESGDRSLRNQLKVPKDYLSALASDSGGSIFSQTVLSRNFRAHKSATSILGRRVAASGVPSSCQICDCLATREGSGYYLCYQCLVDNFDFLAHTWNTLYMDSVRSP